ncbi:MAG: hypothetical protein LBF67_06860 [Prevotellaceae bacterium]|jgi:hypothetical protein|nr:hypothetical protein [Prevotellaceae bacterium]
METTKMTKAEDIAATPTKAKRKTRREIDKEGWYMDERGIKIPLDEYFKDYPKPTGPKRSDVFKKNGMWPLITEIVDMRAVMK